MAVGVSHTCVLLCAIILSLLLLKASCVRIEIKPERANENVDTVIEVSCIQDAMDDQGTILLMEISNDKDNPIASISENSRISQGVGVPFRFQAYGLIDSNGNQSYINLKIDHPVSDDSGKYKCLRYYNDKDGQLKKDVATGDVLVGTLNIAELYARLQQLETMVKNISDSNKPSSVATTATLDPQVVAKLAIIKDVVDNMTRVADDNKHLSQQINDLKNTDTIVRERINVLESNNKNSSLHITELTDQVTNLEDHRTNQSEQIRDLAHKETLSMNKIANLEFNTKKYSQQITNLADKASNTSAFYATIDKYTRISPKMVLIFSDVMMRQGPGYDEETGVFTAPRAGVYVFNLVMTISEDGGTVMLFVNDKDVAILICYDKTRTWDQSSVSAVVDLQAGDTVKAVVERTYGDNPVVDSHRFSLFSGYLLHPF